MLNFVYWPISIANYMQANVASWLAISFGCLAAGIALAIAR